LFSIFQPSSQAKLLKSNSIRVELTATRRTALHRYTFPAGTAHPRLLLDLTNDGQKSSTNPEMTLDPATARVMGGASFSGSFGPGSYHDCSLSFFLLKS
jgi:putative alpha-1,2-mannosidase